MAGFDEWIRHADMTIVILIVDSDHADLSALQTPLTYTNFKREKNLKKHPPIL